MHSLTRPSIIIRTAKLVRPFKSYPLKISYPFKKQSLNCVCSSSRIICTDSQHCTALSHKIQLYHENLPLLVEPSQFLKDNFNISDASCAILPCKTKKLQEIICAEEFKDILSRSSFCFNVNLAENSKCLLPMSGVFFYSIEDVYSHSSYKFEANNTNEVICSSDENEAKSSDSNKPSEDQLLSIINKLTNSLLHFFDKPHDYTFYHKNIIFQNNIKGVTIKGLSAYIQAMYVLKFYGLLQHAKVTVDILKITHHVEDGTIRVRWRVKYISRPKLLLKIWKLKDMRWADFFQEEAEWLDGFSVFSVGSDGLIYKHVCDKMTPDDDTVTTKNSLRSKLMGLLELNPRGSTAGTLHTLMPMNQVFSRKLT